MPGCFLRPRGLARFQLLVLHYCTIELCESVSAQSVWHDAYFFLNVEHSVSEASEQHERMPAWLATLIDSAVQWSDSLYVHSSTLHFTFVEVFIMFTVPFILN